jgi:hypothetical protein
MVVSKNPEPNKEAFLSLLNSTLIKLDLESKEKKELYLKTLGTKLEDVVAEIMSDKAKGTPFENSIELYSGQRFPDIVANKFYGVEVKTTNKNHWTTTGNSILEGTRVKDVERIFMLFGKMISPIEFKCRPYEDCLSDVVVTHSPRYLINMDLSEGNTIFDKLKMPYDKLRREPNPVKPIIDYYRKNLNKGQELWWLDQEGDSGKSIIIKYWNSLPKMIQKKYVSTSMIYFPEVFNRDYNHCAFWLYESESIICPNVRDQFSAGGTGSINWNKKTYFEIPRIILNLIDSLDEINDILKNTDKNTLCHFWGNKFKNKQLNWINLIVENTKKLYLPFNLKDYLIEKMIE